MDERARHAAQRRGHNEVELLELNELKLVSASNIIKLRQGAGLTQAELGARLNYSDKTISKWERGEAIPDAFVLTQLAAMFNVTVDYLLSSHDAWEAPAEPEEEPVEPATPADREYSENMITALVFVSIWTACILAFVTLWLAANIVYWQIFAIALPVSLLVVMILMCVFKKRAALQYIIAAFVFSIFVMLYFVLPGTRPWQLFLIGVPAVVIVFLACNIQRRPRKRKKT